MSLILAQAGILAEPLLYLQHLLSLRLIADTANYSIAMVQALFRHSIANIATRKQALPIAFELSCGASNGQR